MGSCRAPTSAIERPAPDHHLDVSPSWSHGAGCELIRAATEQLRVRRFGAERGLRVCARPGRLHGTSERVRRGAAGSGGAVWGCCCCDGRLLEITQYTRIPVPPPSSWAYRVRGTPRPAHVLDPGHNNSCGCAWKTNQTHSTSRIRRTSRRFSAVPMSDDPNDMFAPPINRAMKVLDRSFFRKTVNTSAARIFSPKDISHVRTALERSRDALKIRLDAVRPDTDAVRAAKGGKCLILKPEVVHNGTTHTCPTTVTMAD